MALLENLTESHVSVTRSATLGSVLLLFIWIAWKVTERVRSAKKYNLPNLIPGLPLVGNAHQIPASNACLHFQDLAKRHGEMFTINIGGTYWLFLNSRRVVHELLEKRAAIYSSRMNLPMAYRVISNEKRTLLMPYGDLWRRERKIMHQILDSTQANVFGPFQDIESKILLYNYLKQPESWFISHGVFSGSVIMSVVFGQRAGADNRLQELLAVAEQFVPYLEPGRSFVDNFPFLLNLPLPQSLQPWRWWGDKLYRRTRSLYEKEMNALRERMRSGVQNNCFMSQFYESGKGDEFEEDELLFIAGALIEAGTDTTRVSLTQCVAAAILWPDWVERVREQIDKVCGANAERLPTEQDAPDLPLVKAVVKESVRWKPCIGETGIPHALICDDVFEGYTIPAGTVVTWNHWANSNSPDEYTEPERFWPERFLNEDIDKPLKGHLGFGAGRRACVGYNVANSNLFIALARLLYCFEFSQPDDAPPLDTSKPLHSATTTPPFPVSIKIRSQAHQYLIERECDSISF
ncbi:hypothetical protein PFICI_03996 [Pestalotiopsis fici W106-1]|uniref:Cytochrome P450 n=1 Tax=Pestalotiopsis fici (strain W106-1 / CGMCC3.15140) TaxID=1229662 RepID=W3XL37_PESFW|nr:uncharacterized protein PFICI_03996 [Pestalotiopsis fici W106-1]ETS85971.1 hypothetical protein PFICI_03996 [Pestalotiopsis fici W106-1]